MTGVYDARDRLLSYGTTEYSYTPDGELAVGIDSVTGAMTTYDYDALGNLRSVGQPDGGAIEYLVDGQNRRVGEKVNGVVEQQWVWQGALRPPNPYIESGEVTARIDSQDRSGRLVGRGGRSRADLARRRALIRGRRSRRPGLDKASPASARRSAGGRAGFGPARLWRRPGGDPFAAVAVIHSRLRESGSWGWKPGPARRP